VNYYATTGKSGGQKGKLAFTILASALSAQYGLSKSPSDSPNFRLVVIDEAFSRTDESNSHSRDAAVRAPWLPSGDRWSVRCESEAVLGGPWVLEQERVPPVDAERALHSAFP
jgi:hypothetical protein